MRKNRTIHAILAAGSVLLAAVLIILGLLRVMNIYRHYRADMLSYESRHLNSIVSSSARGLDWMLGGYRTHIHQLIDRREFILAEEEYETTGDQGAMEILMARPDVLVPYMSYSAAVYDGDGTFLAATDESFPAGAVPDETIGEGIFLRRDGEGVYWFVLGAASDRDLYYELAVPVGRHGYLFPVDRENRLFVYSGNDASGIQEFDAVLEQFPPSETEELEKLSQIEGMRPDEYRIFRYDWPEYSDIRRPSDETLVVTAPLIHSGTDLVVGAALSFGEFSSFLSDTLSEVTWVILMEIGGALVLFGLMAWILVTNRRNALALAAVKEKADLMEEINRQQQSLYHSDRLQQLGVMTSGIVHEFNNMLTPIMGQSHLLLEQLADQEDSPQFENALDIFEASENARAVLRRMSGIGKKDVDMSFTVLDLNALLRKTENLAAMAKEPRIRQELILPEKPVYIQGNDRLLTQAFLNLCINACQAMGSDGTLTIRMEEEQRSGQVYARVEFSDTGPGIAEEKMGSLYEPFFTTKGERGTGLGLAICQKIVETHKGTIAAANREEGGAVFTVRIPSCPAPEED